MPNWCSNTLEVFGNPEQLEEFRNKSMVPADSSSPNEYDFTFEGLYPTPQEFLDTDWYNWRISNWGTKWDCDNSYVAFEDEDCFIVSYDTAWGPNINWMKTVSEKFPDLKFRLAFMEPGVGFCGVARCQNGDLDVDEGDIELEDGDNNRLVKYDRELERYRYVDTNEVIEDEDFWPIEVNPFDE
jgi:hypothetical protein